MNAIRRILELTSKPEEQHNSEDAVATTPTGMLSRAIVLFNKYCFGSLAPGDLSSDHQALLDYFGPPSPGDEYELNLQALQSEYTTLHAKTDGSFVEQQYHHAEVLVELLWAADDYEGGEEETEISKAPENCVSYEEATDFVDVFEMLYCNSVPAGMVLSSTNTSTDSSHDKHDDRYKGNSDEPRCKSFPLDTVRNLAHTEFEVSTELNDEFFSRQNPGRRLDHLPIVYLNLRRTKEGSL